MVLSTHDNPLPKATLHEVKYTNLTQLTTRSILLQVYQRFWWHPVVFVFCQGLRYCSRLGAEQFPVPSGQQFIVAIYVCAFACSRSFPMRSSGCLDQFQSFLVFSPTLLSLYYCYLINFIINVFWFLLFILLLNIIVSCYYYCYYFSYLH